MTFLAFLVVVALLLSISPWIIMLVVGGLYHEFGFWQPISFGQAILISVALGIVSRIFKSSR